MDRPAPMPAAAPAPQAEEGLEARAADDMAKKSEEPAKPAAAATPPPPEKKPEARMAGRATREGLFGMDLRLLQSGPAVTASRLTPGGALDLRWRTAASRAVGAVLTGLLAFLAGFLARRRGIPCPAWTVLALALFTAAPVVLASTDPAPWDGAAAGTLAFGVIALLQGIHRWDVKRASSRAAATTAAAVVAILLLAGPAAAQEGRKGAKIAPPPPEDAPDRVYAPYDPSRPETLRLPERVFLPYARYVELWNAAHPEDRMEPARPPVVASASYDARVEGRMLVVAARFDVDPADGGLVPLPPGAALDDLILDGKPAATAIAAPGGAVLVPVPKSATPGARVAIEATLRFPIGGREPGGEVRSPLPPAPRCRLTALLPIADPVLSLTAAGGWTSAPEGAATRLEADLGPVTALDLRWSPRGADAAGGRLRFEVSASADLVLREDHCVLVSSATVEVQAGTLDRLDLALPEGWEPRGVAGPAVASWTVAGTGDARRLAVRLAGATSGKSTVTVTALRVGAPPADGLEVPGLAADGAASDRLTVRVAAGRSSRLAATVAGSWERAEAGSPGEGVALDPARGERVQAAWRRTRPAGRLVVRAEPLPSALSVAARQHLFLGAEASLLAADLDIEPGPAGLFEASIALPAGWTLEDAQGGEAFAEPGRVRVLLPGPPGSTRTVRLRLRGPAAGDAAFAFPALRVEGATRESAELLVSTARGFAATAAPGAGMDPVPVDRFSAWPPLDPEEQRALGFRSARGPGDLSLRREAVRSTVRPMVIADVTVLDDRAIVDALLVYEVRGGPARVFRFRSPPGVKDTWVLGDGIRETRIETADGRETVTVTMQAAAAGEVSFRALYEIPVPPGAEVPVAGPEPEGGEAPRAFVFVRAAGDAEARLGDAPGMEPCDAADLPKIPEGLDPRRVLRFYRARDAAWRLPLRLVSHETGGVPDARIHLVEAVTVVDRDGSSRTRIEARLFNRALAFLPVVLPPQASLESVLAAGVPVRPVTRASEPGRVLVPVRRQSLGEDSQVVSLTFSSPAVAPGGRFGALEPRLPEFPDVPVDATTWRLLLPEDRDWAFGGNLDPVEEAEVEIARAEAYAEDIGRLRKVVNEGTVGQRTLAGENVVRNTRELRQTLERAQSRIDLLETAAAEGKVDQGRVAEARRKAQDLGKEIEDALKDVEKNAPQSLAALREPGSGPDRGPAGQPPSDSRMPDEPPAPDAGGGPFEADKRLSTKEAQAGKRWASNFRNDTVQQEEKSRDDARRANEQALRGQYGEAGLGAVVQHQQFDASSVEGRLVGGKDWGLPTLDATLGRAADFDTETAMLQPSGGGAFSIPPDVSVSLSGTLPASLLALKRGYAPGGGGGGGGHQYAGSNYFGSGGGSGAGGAVAVYGRAGLVSLTPPLEERDRAYAFRKLDAGAEMRITPRALDLGRRALAAAAFALVAGLVWLMMRRRAAAKR
jgi:hypothetical protein